MPKLETNKRPVTFLGVEIPKTGAMHVRVVQSILTALDTLNPNGHGTADDLARKLASQGVKPEEAYRAYIAMGQLPKKSHQRMHLQPRISAHRPTLYDAFLKLLPERERKKYIIETRTPPPQASFPKRATPRKYPNDDDRKFS